MSPSETTTPGASDGKRREPRLQRTGKPGGEVRIMHEGDIEPCERGLDLDRV